MNELHELYRVPIGTAWLPEEPLRLGDDRPHVFEVSWDYIEDGHLIRHFGGQVTLQQGLRGSTVEVQLEMTPNPNECWQHEPVEESVDLEIDLLSGHGVKRWSIRHGIGELRADDGPRKVWSAKHSAAQLLASDISHMELYLWRERFVRCK